MSSESDFPTVGIGRAKTFREVIDLARELARIPRPILVRGERGTGKELLARYIHECSSRRDKTYRIVNCGAFHEELLVSHMFGHEKGSFTGASDRRQGIFERAHGGTLFLDEIANLSLPAQSRLHRVVEYQTFQRVGGSDPIQVDVRIVAATNADLEAKIKEGTFMADLYDRLAFAEITLPPLRKRRDDIPLLIEHFIRLLHDEIPDLGHAEVTPEAVEQLQTYRWPGNVRELKNVIERLYVSDRDRVIHASELPIEIAAGEPFHGTFKERVSAFERALLVSALRDAKDNQREAAKALGLTYDQFRHQYKKHELATEP
ncbi:MAG: AAA domain-containing protein [bacterium]|nr:AAA domain-containing protein [bacterium]